MADFERLGVAPSIIRAVSDYGWELPTAIQDEAIPLILGGGDVCAASETGTGKTGAFVLPCLQIVHEYLHNKAIVHSTKRHESVSNECPCVLNVYDKDSFIAVDNTYLNASSTIDRWQGIRGTIGILEGKHMFEVKILSPGLVRVGWAASYSSRDIGTDNSSYGYGGTGKISWNRTYTSYGEPFSKGDIIGCLINRDDQTVSFTKNGILFGIAFELSDAMKTVPLKPAVCGKLFHISFNCAGPFIYPQSCYNPINTNCKHSDDSKTTSELQVYTSGNTSCLVLEPTRELAKQTYDCFTQMNRYLEIPVPNIRLFVGGHIEPMRQNQKKQKVDIVIGTLPKIKSLIQQNYLHLDHIRLLVLDEADELLANSFADILKIKHQAIHDQVSRVQTIIFSATLHSPLVRSSISQITINPTWIDLKGVPSIPDTVHVVCYQLDPKEESIPCQSFLKNKLEPNTDRVHVVGSVIKHDADYYSQRSKILKPQLAVGIADAFGMETCLIFCRTNLDCNNFELYLTTLGGGQQFKGETVQGKGNPYSCVVLAGMRSQEEREKNLQHFVNGNVRFLICTDVAARGLDIKRLPYLIMLTLPDDPYLFFHRVGRVGRQDHMGLAICLVSKENEKVWYHRCGNKSGNCTNRKLLEHNGCCMWYSDMECLLSIEKIIGTSIPIMNPNHFSVEGIIQLQTEIFPETDQEKSQTQRRPNNCLTDNISGSPTLSVETNHLRIYGKEKNNRIDLIASQRFEEIAPCSHELHLLEKEIQEQYFALLSYEF